MHLKSNSFYEFSLIVSNSISDIEVYLKAKIAEVQHISNDEGTSFNSDPIAHNSQSCMKIVRPIYHTIDALSARRSVTNESKASVYFTPNDSVDQAQLQLSPMHINIIEENLDTFPDWLKPSESACKFDFNMHRFEADLELEIDRRRRRHVNMQTEDDDDDEIIEIDTEKTQMLNRDDRNVDAAANNASQYIRLNTLPRRNKCKRTGSGKDFYYSLENVFDPMPAGSSHFQMHLSNKTIDEASCEETQMTNSASDNCSSTQSNTINTDEAADHRNPSQSVLVLNEVSTGCLSEMQMSNSMPNISKSKRFTKVPDVVQKHEVDNNSQSDAMLPN